MNTSALIATGLGFDTPQGNLFANLSLQLPPGVHLIRGGDGKGKTSLLRLLAGDLPAHTGNLHLHGIALHAQPLDYRAQVFWPDYKNTAYDQATPPEFWAALAQQHRHFDMQSLPALIEGLSLTEHLHKSLYMLSTGSKRKVWLAGALACGAALTLIDDPFSALDIPSIRFVTAQLKAAALACSPHHTPPSQRIWVVAHYAHLGDVPVASTLDLGD